MTAGPDLIVRDFNFDSIYWVAGNVLTWTWVAENQGDLGAFSTTMGVFLSTDNVITPSDTLLVTDGATGFMFPGDVQDVPRPGYTVSASIAPGTYYAGVYIDPSDFRLESDETNNASNVVQVTVSAQPLGADFIAEGLEFGSYVWQQGDNVSADWHMINQGDDTSPSVQSSLYLSTDPIVDTNDFFVGSDQVSGMMSPGENNMETITNGFTVPGLAPGTYYAAAFADSSDQTAEIDETNNWSPVVQVQVVAPATNGDDVIDMRLSRKDENVSGLDGDDTISTGSGNDTLDGGLGDDLLSGGPGADVLIGGGGSDAASYLTAGAAVTVDLQSPASNTGDAAGDTFFQISNIAGSSFYSDNIFGSVAANTLFGGGGDDHLYGRGGDDKLVGAAGNDFLVGGIGADDLNGGLGIDRAAYWTAQGAIRADLLFAHVNTGDAAGDTYASIEDLQGSVHNDDLRGDNGDNTIWGNNGNDTIHGRGGDDTLNGQNGNDILIGYAGGDDLDGGAGTDRAAYWTASAAIRADLQFAHVNTGDAAGDTYVSIEDLQGSSHNDDLRGNNMANTIWGGNGNDTIHGRGGDDTLNGQNGNDILIGYAGGDDLDGGAGTDRAAYWTASAAIRADLQFAHVNTGDAAGDTYVSIEDLQGSSHNDDLRGDNTANTIWGGNGNDTIHGRGGDDTLNGQNGNDVLIGYAGGDDLDGGTGTDRATYWTAGSAVTADLMNAAVNVGDAAGDTYTSIENLQGSNHNDDLRGDAGSNMIWGGNGDDAIRGRGGNDTLLGQGGNDTFFFENGFGNDVIIGFEAFNANEKIDLSMVTNIVHFADLQANHLSQAGADAVITDGAGTITLLGVQTTDLDAGDFAF